MALTMKFYANGINHLGDADIDWTADTIKVSLHTSTYTPDQDADDFHDDATNELAAGNGYTAGGETLASTTRTVVDGAPDSVRFDAADVTWTFTASKTFRYAVIYKDRGGASSADELIGWGDFGSDQTVSTAFTIQWGTNGIFEITVS